MVAPVRCATPATDVAWTYQPFCSASAISQSVSTPPPCPPIARMAMVIGRSRAIAFMAGEGSRTERWPGTGTHRAENARLATNSRPRHARFSG